MVKSAWVFFKKNKYVFIFLTILVGACYANSINNVFISDDFPSIVDNKALGDISYIFSRPQAFGRNLPLYFILKIFGLTPAFFRLFNIFLHLGNTWLVFVVVYLLNRKKIVPFASAVIFAVHPLLVESVTWISGGGYAQYTFFFLFSFIYYILFERNKKPSLYFFSLFFFFLSLISNRNAIVLPAIFITYDLSIKSVLKKWKYYIPFFALAFVWLLLYFNLLQERIVVLQSKFYQPVGYDNPLFQIPIALYSYFELIFIPIWLTFYHTELNFGLLKFICAAVLTIMYFCILVYTYVRKKEYFFWFSVFIIPLLPTLTPLRISWTVAERYAYLSLLGIVVPVVSLGTHFYRNKKLTNIMTTIFILIITLLSIRTILRNIDWKTDANLWIATGKISPSSPWNHNNLGDLYARQGDFKRSIAEFNRAIELLPNYADAYHNMGNVYKGIGQNDKALESYFLAVKYNPNLWQTYLNIGAVYFEMGKLQKAADSLIRATEISPANSILFSNLGLIYYRMGNKNEAKKYFTKALELDPTNQKAQLGLSSLN